MKFQVGRFTCELSLDAYGRMRAQWLPERPKYLGRTERAQYRAGRAAFLSTTGPGSSGCLAARSHACDPGASGFKTEVSRVRPN
jgi:hypothetical protein